MACFDSTVDEDSLYWSCGLPYTISSTDSSRDLEYNPMHMNVMLVKTRKRPLPSLRVIAIVVLATLRFNRHQQFLLDKLISSSDLLPSLPPASSCKHMTSSMISDLILVSARRWEMYNQQNENNYFLSNFSEAIVESPTSKVLHSRSLIELIKKQQKNEKVSSENVEKKVTIKSVCNTPIFWYNLSGVTDIYGLKRLETISSTLLMMNKSLRESREREVDLHVKIIEKDHELELMQSRLHQTEKEVSDQRQVMNLLDTQQRENSKGILKVIRQHLHNATSVEPEYHEELNHIESPEKRLLGIYENIGRLSQKQSPSLASPSTKYQKSNMSF